MNLACAAETVRRTCQLGVGTQSIRSMSSEPYYGNLYYPTLVAHYLLFIERSAVLCDAVCYAFALYSRMLLGPSFQHVKFLPALSIDHHKD